MNEAVHPISINQGLGIHSYIDQCDCFIGLPNGIIENRCESPFHNNRARVSEHRVSHPGLILINLAEKNTICMEQLLRRASLIREAFLIRESLLWRGRVFKNHVSNYALFYSSRK